MLGKREVAAFLLMFVWPMPSSLNDPLQSRQPKPEVVLEVRHVNYGIGNYRHEWLLGQLLTDGTVEWETPVGLRSHERHAAKVSLEEVTAITGRLNAIESSGIKDRMGPYNTYTDSSVELKVRVTLATGQRRFSVINPFPGYMPKPMPKNVKAMICEAYNLRAKVAGEEAPAMCERTP